MFSDALSLAIDLPRFPPDWRRLGKELPYEWIEAALEAKGKASIRRRRLPAQQVVWLVIALALYRHLSVKEVLDDLDLALPELEGACLTASAACQARQRLGPEPLRWLFECSAQAWSEEDHSAYLFHGMSLFAMDGTTLRLAESEANRAHFGAQKYAKGSVASYPQAKGVTLTAVPTHLILDARFGPYATSEASFAKELIASVPDSSLTVFDAGFLSAEILCNLAGQGHCRHYLIPAKSNTRWKLIEGTVEDGLVEMEVSDSAMRKDPTLLASWRARAVRIGDGTGELKYVLTSLTDKKAITAKQIVDCYWRRWAIETSYREIKQTMLGSAHTLRSMTVDGTMQEIWGALIAYNLLRIEIAKAALEAKCQPTDISFVLALHTIQYELLIAAATQAQGKLPATLKRLRERLVLDLKTHRPGRKFDRVVKAKAQRYPVTRLKSSA
ncbi:IS4 family transposase [Massilia antarctica]|uniref:IS4 family transposase n=2 Tax=Massilia antarctica TaxID=2765360 RepID=A0AA49A6A8_9BURK|nr:IS4 family transposase [Massilia antarctica]QPI47357.1 IS4 family transposase [Massilia antarctica]QPI47477.1 IS4 family transposase [Massilia antarctica]QPI50631.1 IS4 family transposase [Massilia antarctica]